MTHHPINQNLNNPNNSSGRASGNINSLAFPTTEILDKNTTIRFFNYGRSVGDGNPTRTHESTIVLPVPVNITDNYTMEINQADLGIYAAIGDSISRGGSVQAAAKGIGSAALNALMTDTKTSAALLVALSPIGTDKQSRTAQTSLGIINNPHTTAVFNGVRLKQWSFTWRLSPRNAADSARLEQIVLDIKRRMHPNKTSGVAADFALDYPDLCTVSFENTQNLPNVRFSFIESFTVSNGNSGGLAFFNDGYATDIELALTLKEIDILTREDIT